MRHAATLFLQTFELTALFYFIVVNSIYLAFTCYAYAALVRHRRRWTAREIDSVLRSPATPGVSIVVPAFNEQAGIVHTVRSLLSVNYPQFEIIVVNDGSSDRTAAVLIETFGLVTAPLVHDAPLPTAPIRGIYRSLRRRDVVVVDKANGGKADAVNAGINAARYPLLCVIDADSVLEAHGLTRAVLPFIEDPTTVAAGGIIRVGNGCRFEDGHIVDVRAPRSWLARFQVIEYLRAFLAARVTLSAFNSLLIISGAFGVFRRDLLITVGGLDTKTVGEDMELVVRLHRFCRNRGTPYRIVFQADPVVWTEAPETIRSLARQRNRWQRGTLEVLARHAGMIGRRRYGRLAFASLPFYALVEAGAPVFELIGLVAILAGWAAGLIDWQMAELVLLASVAYGTLVAVAAMLLEEMSFRRYLRLGDVVRLFGAALLENFGYRQLTSWWRLQGTLDYWRGRTEWGAMTRRGLTP